MNEWAARPFTLLAEFVLDSKQNQYKLSVGTTRDVLQNVVPDFHWHASQRLTISQRRSFIVLATCVFVNQRYLWPLLCSVADSLKARNHCADCIDRSGEIWFVFSEPLTFEDVQKALLENSKIIQQTHPNQ